MSTSTLWNCIIYSNTAPSTLFANYYNCPMTNSCTTPLPTAGTGNITNPPSFVDMAGGNFRLQSNSPCINAGNNAAITNAVVDRLGYHPNTNTTDLDGRMRVAEGRVDMGAYENESAFDAWLTKYGLPANGPADFTDPDHDGYNNHVEYRCGTDPTNVLSRLSLLPPVRTGTNVTLTWPSRTGVTYRVERRYGLSPWDNVFSPLATSLPGQPGTTTYTHTNVISFPLVFYRMFYRVGLE